MKFKDVEPYAPRPRVSCGIRALDKLFGCNRSNGPLDRPAQYGLHFPSSILLTGMPGVGKTELLLQMRGLWTMPVHYFGGGMRMTNEAVRAVASMPTSENHVLILDGVGVNARDVVRMHMSDITARTFARILIVVQATAREKRPTVEEECAKHEFSTHLHMKKCEYRTILKCTKNRFGTADGEIYRLDDSLVWKDD
jgi:hypothetical protein